MTPYDELIARISDLIRDGDRTVKARAEDIVGEVYAHYYGASDERMTPKQKAETIQMLEKLILACRPTDTPFLRKYKPDPAD